MKQTISFKNADFLPEVLKLINEGHTVTLPLGGVSMRPFLEDGRDKALLTKATTPHVGDPVLAMIDQRYYVLHRVVKIEGGKVTLLGDGNLTPEHCTVDDIVASVVGFYRKGQSKLDPVNGRKWKAYSWIWMRLLPVRRWLLAFYRRVWVPLFNKQVMRNSR